MEKLKGMLLVMLVVLLCSAPTWIGILLCFIPNPGEWETERTEVRGLVVEAVVSPDATNSHVAGKWVPEGTGGVLRITEKGRITVHIKVPEETEPFWIHFPLKEDWWEWQKKHPIGSEVRLVRSKLRKSDGRYDWFQYRLLDW